MLRSIYERILSAFGTKQRRHPPRVPGRAAPVRDGWLWKVLKAADY